MKPNVKKYLNVFQFLQDYYQFRKSQELQFSYEIWAKQLGLTDKSYLRLIVLGKRPINTKVAEALGSKLDFSSDEQNYFFILIQYTQSRTREHKDVFGKKL